MSSITISLALLFAVMPDEKPGTSKIPIGKDTTLVTGPLDKDGNVDYEAALNERLGKGITAATNANALFFKAFGPKPEGSKMPPGYYKLLGIDEPPEKGSYFVGIITLLRDHLKLNADEFDEILIQHGRAGVRPWKAVDLPHITAWLSVNEKPIDLVVEAVRRPHYFNPLVAGTADKRSAGLISTLMPTVQKCREAASALTARAMQRVAEGKVDAAWQDLLACHRLARHVARGATLLELLVGTAIDGAASIADLAFLDNPKLGAKRIRDCLKDLQQLPPFPSAANKVDLCERFVYLDCVRLIRCGGVKMVVGLADFPLPVDPVKLEKALTTVDWAVPMQIGNRWYDRLSECLRRKDRVAREQELERIDTEFKTLRKDAIESIKLIEKQPPRETVGKIMGDALVGMLMPAIRKVQSGIDRSEQIQRNLHLAFALAAYQRDNNRYPEKLDDLAPRYLAAIPDDLFSGKAIRYCPTEKAYLLYSIGINGKDEEGRWHDDDPPGDDPRVIMPLPVLKIRR